MKIPSNLLALVQADDNSVEVGMRVMSRLVIDYLNRATGGGGS